MVNWIVGGVIVILMVYIIIRSVVLWKKGVSTCGSCNACSGNRSCGKTQK